MSTSTPVPARVVRRSLVPVSRRMVGEAVLEAIRTAVVRGTFLPGERLAEAVLAKELNVSRAPVREAMMQLEREGLLSFDQRGAALVKELKAGDFQEIYSLRLALEPLAAQLTAERASEAVFKFLDGNIAATARAKTLADVSRLDAAFHEAIVQASGHRRLAQCWAGLGHQVLMWLTQMQQQHQAVSRRTRDETVEAHRKLLRVLRTGQGKAAADAMHRHIIGWREWLPLQTR